MLHVLAVSLPHIAPDFSFPYVNTVLAIVAAVIGAVIIFVISQVAIALGHSVQVMRTGHGSVGDSVKVAAMGFGVIALLASLTVVATTFVNWLNI